MQNKIFSHKKYISFILAIASAVIPSTMNAFELSRVTIGAEATALGGAFLSVVNNPSAILWNPAGLANINGKEKQKSQTRDTSDSDQKFSEDSFDKLFDSSSNKEEGEMEPVEKVSAPFEFQLYTSYGYLTMDRHLFMASAAMTLFKGTFGAAAMGTYAPQIDGYNSSGVSTGSLNYGAYSGIIAYAWEMGMAKMGLSINGYNEALDTQNYFGGGLNLGVQMSPIPILHIGAVMQNLPGVIQDSSTDPGHFRKLDTIMKVSLGITTPPPDASLMLLVGLEANLDEIAVPEIYGNIGVQVKFAKYFSIMAGLRNNNFAMGLGFNLPSVKIAYAINQDSLHTGFQHFVDINLAF